MKKILTLLLLLPLMAIASNPSARYVCPNTFQTVLSGDTMAKVENACGKPASATSVQSVETTPVQLTQWVYTPKAQRGLVQNNSQLKITFKENKIVQIKTDDQSNVNAFPCYATGRIKVGTTSQQVQLQCGAPRYVNSIQQGVNKPVTITTWVYNFGSYKPKMIFIFKGDSLTEIKVGQIAK